MELFYSQHYYLMIKLYKINELHGGMPLLEMAISVSILFPVFSILQNSLGLIFLAFLTDCMLFGTQFHFGLIT